MDNDVSNALTKLISVSLNFLVAKSGERTSLGILLGLSLYVVQIYASSLDSLNFLNLSVLKWHHWIIIGLFLVFLPRIVAQFFKVSPSTDEIDSAFALVKKAVDRGLPKNKANELYEEIIRDAIRNKAPQELSIKELDTESTTSAKT